MCDWIETHQADGRRRLGSQPLSSIVALCGRTAARSTAAAVRSEKGKREIFSPLCLFGRRLFGPAAIVSPASERPIHQDYTRGRSVGRPVGDCGVCGGGLSIVRAPRTAFVRLLPKASERALQVAFVRRCQIRDRGRSVGRLDYSHTLLYYWMLGRGKLLTHD